MAAHLVLGLPYLVLWQISRSLWTKKGVYAWYPSPDCPFSRLWLSKRLACLPVVRVFRPLTMCWRHRYNTIGTRYPSACVPSVKGTFSGWSFRSIKSGTYVDTATTYEALALGSGKGTDGRYPCHRTLKSECFHWLKLLGSASGTLLTATVATLFTLIDPSVTCWAFGFSFTVLMNLIVFGADFVYSSGTILIAKTLAPTSAAKLGVTTICCGTDVCTAHGAQWASAAFALMAALLAALFLRNISIVGHNRRCRTGPGLKSAYKTKEKLHLFSGNLRDLSLQDSQFAGDPFLNVLLVFERMSKYVLVTNGTANTSSVSISLPTIEKDLNITEVQLQWLVSAYSLSSGCLLLFFDRLADIYGRKKAFVIGTICQVVFSLGSSFAQSGITLIILRAFQGLGTAATIPSALGILGHAFPPSRIRSIAFATFSAGAPVGGAFGMIIGGVLTQISSTHLALPILFGCSNVCSNGYFQLSTGSVLSLVTIGLVLIVFVLGQGEVASQGWKTPYIIILLIVGIIMVSLFLLWERYLEYVHVSPAWRNEDADYAPFKLYYQNYLLLTPMQTMLRFIPLFVVGCLCNVFVAMFVGKLPLVIFAVFGDSSALQSDLLYPRLCPTSWLKTSLLTLASLSTRAGTNAPRSAQLKGYRSAQWTCASFALMAALLAALSLYGVGIVGDKKITEHVDTDQTIAVGSESEDG
ncbi:major facilitator superfamily domain-containing protein [Suillus subluteus]|nr:major facilitator superfamily domain-containing protein [Suillus subluteus]